MPENQANFFRVRREQLGLSQSDIQRRIHEKGTFITVSAVSGWERGQVPSIDWVDLLAAAYEVPARKILDAMHDMARARVAAATATE